MKYKIGEVIFKEEPITINKNKQTVTMVVNNTGDRSIQVCSHYHFFEANLALQFDREKAFGMRLDVPSGTAVRFEPGKDKQVTLVPYGGKQKVIGFLGAVMGEVTDPSVKEKAFEKMKSLQEGAKK
ncbi:MAG: urease subunit beta [Clostridia bacterium]|nr:urease subunit beta [Clostridia bacterium]